MSPRQPNHSAALAVGVCRDNGDSYGCEQLGDELRPVRISKPRPVVQLAKHSGAEARRHWRWVPCQPCGAPTLDASGVRGGREQLATKLRSTLRRQWRQAPCQIRDAPTLGASDVRGGLDGREQLGSKLHSEQPAKLRDKLRLVKWSVSWTMAASILVRSCNRRSLRGCAVPFHRNGGARRPNTCRWRGLTCVGHIDDGGHKPGAIVQRPWLQWRKGITKLIQSFARQVAEVLSPMSEADVLAAAQRVGSTRISDVLSPMREVDHIAVAQKVSTRGIYELHARKRWSKERRAERHDARRAARPDKDPEAHALPSSQMCGERQRTSPMGHQRSQPPTGGSGQRKEPPRTIIMPEVGRVDKRTLVSDSMHSSEPVEYLQGGTKQPQSHGVQNEESRSAEPKSQPSYPEEPNKEDSKGECVQANEDASLNQPTAQTKGASAHVPVVPERQEDSSIALLTQKMEEMLLTINSQQELIARFQEERASDRELIGRLYEERADERAQLAQLQEKYRTSLKKLQGFVASREPDATAADGDEEEEEGLEEPDDGTIAFASEAAREDPPEMNGANPEDADPTSSASQSVGSEPHSEAPSLTETETNAGASTRPERKPPKRSPGEPEPPAGEPSKAKGERTDVRATTTGVVGANREPPELQGGEDVATKARPEAEPPPPHTGERVRPEVAPGQVCDEQVDPRALERSEFAHRRACNAQLDPQ
ncbi:unnamed protein product, partial [Durusdinium trenchii]